MKTIVPTRIHTAVTMPIVIAAGMMLTTLTGSATEKSFLSGTTVTSHDTILVQKSQVSRKNKIKLYPNASHQVLFFSASGEDGKVYQLFLFNLDGKLIKQVNVRNKQTTVLNKIEKGNYLFEVFSNDERIENGQVIVK